MFSNNKFLKASVIDKGENLEYVIETIDKTVAMPIITVYWMSKDFKMYTTVISKKVLPNGVRSFAEGLTRIAYSDKFKRFLL